VAAAKSKDEVKNMTRATVAMLGIVLIALGTLSPIGGQSAPQQRASQQQQLRANAPGGGLAPDATLPRWPAALNPLDAITPVTDAMLNNPLPENGSRGGALTTTWASVL